MSNIQEIKGEIKDIIRQIHQGGGIEPFNKDIFLIAVNVAGTTYYKENYEYIIPELVKGIKLDLYREAGNKYDDKAILVKYNDIKLGYVPQKDNIVIANLMDGGKLIYGVVDYVCYRPEDYVDYKWLQIHINLFLKD